MSAIEKIIQVAAMNAFSNESLNTLTNNTHNVLVGPNRNDLSANDISCATINVDTIQKKTSSNIVINSDISGNDASFNKLEFSGGTIKGHLIPDVANSYDIGSSTLPIRELYLGPSSLYIDGKKVIESSADTINVSTDTNQHLTVKTSGTGLLKMESASQGIGIYTSGTGDISLECQGTGNIEINSNVSLTGNIEPNANNTYVLGSSVKKFNQIWVGSGGVQGQVSSIANHDTDNLSEGSTNLYHTTSRARGSISAGTGVSYNSTSGQVSIGQTVSTNSNVSFNNLTLTGDISGADASFNNIEVDTINTISSTTLGYVSNVSSDIQSQINLKAPKASPTFTGTPIAPTATASTNTTQIATTAFVNTALSNLVDSAPATLNTLNELAAALGDDNNFSTTVTNSLAGKQNTIADGDLTIAKTSGLQSAINAKQDTIADGDLTIAKTSGLQAAIDTKQNTITTNSLSISHVSGLQSAINAKQNTIADGDLTIAKTSGLQTALDSKQGTLTAGSNITIANDGTISSTGGGGGGGGLTDLSASSISDLSDVDITNIETNQLIKWDGEKMISATTIYSNGSNIGIGTSSPSEKLHVHDTGNTYITISNDSATNGFDLAMATNNDAYFINRENGNFIFTTDGNVGVGTTSPSGKFQIKETATNPWTIGSRGGYNAGLLGFGYKWSNVATTASHADKIKIVPTNTGSDYYSPCGIMMGYWGTTAVSNYYSAIGFVLGDDGDTEALPESKTKMIITRDGYVGIGTVDPDATLHVKKTVTAYGPSIIVDGPSHSFISFYENGTVTGYTGKLHSTSGDMYLLSASTSNDVLLQHNGGNVGIGTQSPSQTLHVNGTVQCTSLSESSDMRIKNNIVDVSDNQALTLLRNIPCRYYEYIDKQNMGNANTIGFIAQEVKQHFPMAVKTFQNEIPDEYREINLNNVETLFFDNSNNIQANQILDSSGNKTLKEKYKITIADLSNSDMSQNFVFYMDAQHKTKNECKPFQNSKSFLFESPLNYLFLYGRVVNDFHSLNKHKLFAINFSASQEIDKQLTIEKQKVSTLENKVSILENTIESLLTRLTALENQ